MAESDKQRILQSLNELADEMPWDHKHWPMYVCRGTLDSAHFVRALTRATGLAPRK